MQVPAGLLGGVLLERFCAAEGSCDGRRLFGALGAFAALTPLLLWLVPTAFREDERALLAEARGSAGCGAPGAGARPAREDETLLKPGTRADELGTAHKK